jgi:hypothetical protein
LSPQEETSVQLNRASEEEIWGALADLFFLDLETGPEDVDRVANLLRENGWSRKEVERTLVELIAPVAGGNVGYMLFPVNGIWTGFDTRWLGDRIARRRLARTTYPTYLFWLSDFWCRRMLRALDWEQLLERLP